MAAFAGEPWRGLTKIQLDDGLGRRNYTASIVDVTPDIATGDQASWEGSPGTSVTLRFEWDTIGNPTFGIADTATIAIRIPADGANIGATWSPAIGGANNGVVEQTFHFDDNPLDGSIGTARAGMIEIFVQVQRVANIAWGPVDSRGGGTPPAATTHNWARGYLRAPVTLSTFSISNVSLGSSEPSPFGFPDSIFTRGTLDAIWYRAGALALAARQSGSDKRTDTGVSQTGITRDYTWDTTATTITGKGRVNNSFIVGSTLTDIRFTLPNTNFGGDNEYVWANSGHASGFVVSGQNLDTVNKITVDPRITFSQIMQLNDSAFATPPASGDDGTQRLTNDLGFLAARAVNSRSEGINSLAWTEKLWDNGELVGSEASPVASRSTTSATKGGQTGWSDAFLIWDETLPTGIWKQKEIITTTDATGLELSNSRSLTLIGVPAAVGGIMVETVVKQGATVQLTVVTFKRNASGNYLATDADSIPIVSIQSRTESGNLTIETAPTLTKRSATTGIYEATFTAPSLDANTVPLELLISIDIVFDGAKLRFSTPIMVISACG